MGKRAKRTAPTGENIRLLMGEVNRSESEEIASGDERRGRGCLTSPAIYGAVTALVGIIAIALAVSSGGDDDSPGVSACRSNRSAVGVVAQDPCPPDVTVAPESPTTVLVTAPPSTAPATAEVATTATVPGAAPPDPAALAPGQVLHRGVSGEVIGPIAQDGKNRFVSIAGPGVKVNDFAAAATPWNDEGTIVEFGVRIDGENPFGQYGFAVFTNVGEYRAGCSVGPGSTSCSSTTEAPLHAGESVAIIVGEAGNVGATGEVTFEWWFVFQPAG